MLGIEPVTDSCKSNVQLYTTKPPTIYINVIKWSEGWILRINYQLDPIFMINTITINRRVHYKTWSKWTRIKKFNECPKTWKLRDNKITRSKQSADNTYTDWCTTCQSLVKKRSTNTNQCICDRVKLTSKNQQTHNTHTDYAVQGAPV